MRKTIIKWGLLGAILIIGTVAVRSAPETVESFLPAVNVVKPIKSEYSKTINGMGVISLESIPASGREETSVLKKERWLAHIAINEAYIRFIEPGQKATISGAAFDSGFYTATVAEISNKARQQNTGLSIETVVDVILEISAAEPLITDSSGSNGLRPGYTVKAQISIGEPQEILIVPYRVVCQDDEGEYIYLLKNRKAIRQDIITGTELEHGIQVVYGLSEEDEIITDPKSINENALVKLASEPSLEV